MKNTFFSRPADAPQLFIGVGGIGSGSFYALEGDHTLGRNESRPGRLLDVRDYCKLHIIAHYSAVLLGAGSGESAFRVVPVGKVGADAAGERLVGEMTAAGMDIQFVETVSAAVTLHSVCFQYPDGSGGNITTSNGAASLLSADDVRRVRPLLQSVAGRAVVLAAPEVPLEPRLELLKAGRDSGAFNVAALTSAEMEDAVSAGMLHAVDLLALNEDEAAMLAGMPFAAEGEAFFTTLINRLHSFNPEMRVIVSAGAAGAWAYAEGRWQHSAVVDVAPVSTAGAGDALLGGVIAALTAGVPLIDTVGERRGGQPRRISCALDLGVTLASLSVTSPHTIHPDADLPRLRGFIDDAGIVVDGRLAELFA